MKLDEHLGYIRSILERDKQLARHLGFNVQPKNNGDKRRIQKFTQYMGPDDDTRKLLTTNVDNWYHQPLRFWDHSSTIDCDVSVDPQEQIYKAFLQSTHDSA
jgi:hypothetical protein